MSNALYIGLMTGTSVDGVDAVLVDFSSSPLKLIATHDEPIAKDLRKTILDLCSPGDNAIQRMGEVDVRLGRLLGETCLKLLDKNGYTAEQVRAIGSHGQTIRHMPNCEFPFTLQIGDPNIIAAITNITVVADFRRRDMALGGQAAPLAPAFHDFLLRDDSEDRCVLNIGGMANITLLQKDRDVIGFDTGPGNTLLDAWCLKHTGETFDRDGAWAASGNINSALLEKLLADEYFSKAPPKSTGREYFNLKWLESHLDNAIIPQDVQASLVELTARSIADAIFSAGLNTGSVWLCGGGTHNTFLIERLRANCKNLSAHSTDEIGIHPDWIEAVAFAWLAHQTMNGKPGNLPSVTGASSKSVLGAIYP